MGVGEGNVQIPSPTTQYINGLPVAANVVGNGNAGSRGVALGCASLVRMEHHNTPFALVEEYSPQNKHNNNVRTFTEGQLE